MDHTPVSVQKVKIENRRLHASQSETWISSPDDALLYEAASFVETTVQLDALSYLDSSYECSPKTNRIQLNQETPTNRASQFTEGEPSLGPVRRVLFSALDQSECSNITVAEGEESLTFGEQTEVHADSFDLVEKDSKPSLIGVEQPPNFSFGFTTAKGTSVNVSETALQRAKQLIAAVDIKPDVNAVGESSTASRGAPSTKPKLDFANANGRALTVSSAALKRAEQRMWELPTANDSTPSSVLETPTGAEPLDQFTEDCEVANDTRPAADVQRLEIGDASNDSVESNHFPVEKQTIVAGNAPSFASGFRTAKGNAPILVTRGAMQNASNVLRDVDLNANAESKKSNVSNPLKTSRTAKTAAAANVTSPDRKKRKIEVEPNTVRSAAKRPIRELVDGALPGSHIYSPAELHDLFGIPIKALLLDFETASDFQFDNPSASNWRTAHTILTTGATKNRVNAAWTQHHYGMVVWKLAALAVSFPAEFAGAFSFSSVLAQLTHRAARENDAQRSCLRMLFENDESSARRLVLTVAGRVRVVRVADVRNSFNVTSVDVSRLDDSRRMANKSRINARNGPDDLKLQPRVEFEVTDGWYVMHAVMTGENAIQLCESGKLTAGVKLFVALAQIHRCKPVSEAANAGRGTEMSSWSLADCGEENGQPCSPLDDGARSVFMRLHVNSTRRARWDAKLGFCRDARPFPVPMRSLFTDGGTVGCVELVICRVYPTLFLERVQADEDSRGICLFRNERSEIPIRLLAEERAKQTLDELCRSVWAQELAASGITDSETAVPGLTQFTDRVRSRVERLLDGEDADAGDESRRLRRPAKRDVVPLVRLRVVGNPPDDCDALLTVWRPTEALVETFREGAVVRAYALQVAPTHRASALSTQLQLNSAKGSSFVEISNARLGLQARQLCHRVPFSVQKMYESHVTPPFCEVDVQGIVQYRAFVDPEGGPSGQGLLDTRVEILVLRDELAEDAALVIECRNTRVSLFDRRPGFAEFGFSDLLAVGNTVCIRNLQYKHTARRTLETHCRSLPLAFFTELSTVSRATCRRDARSFSVHSLSDSQLASSTQDDLECHALLDRIETESALLSVTEAEATCNETTINEHENEHPSVSVSHVDLNATVRESDVALSRESAAAKTSTPLPPSNLFANASSSGASGTGRFRVGMSRRHSASFIAKTGALDLVRKTFGRQSDAPE